MTRPFKAFLLFAVCALMVSPACIAQLRLPALISDHALLQANRPVAIWGWSRAGEAVTVTLSPTGGHAQSTQAIADANGRWICHLEAQPDGVAGELLVSAQGEDTKVVHDVLFGEVWLGSGQSNMEYDIVGTGRVDKTRPEEVEEVAQNVRRAKLEAQSAQPPIRYFRVAVRHAKTPTDDVNGHWILVGPTDVGGCSALAWNFMVALQAKLKTPLGLIVSAVGNTPIEVWMSRETLLSTPSGKQIIERNRVELAESTPERMKAYESAMADWKAANPRPELQAEHKSSRPVGPANPSASNYVPNQYFNGMISGLQPYTVRGILWYQGTSNMFHPTEYGDLLVALIREWRTEWQDPQLPFLFVEESNFGPKQTNPVEPNGVSTVREQQHVALKLEATGMAVSMDLGNGNPHYPNKRAIADRLAAVALVQCYHEQGDPQSPSIGSFKIEGHSVRLKLLHAESVRLSSGDALRGFALKGEDGMWKWATGKIEGTDIVLSSADVSWPVAVRYAWAQNPVTSVVNEKGLPLIAFRSDTDR